MIMVDGIDGIFVCCLSSQTRWSIACVEDTFDPFGIIQRLLCLDRHWILVSNTGASSSSSEFIFSLLDQL